MQYENSLYVSAKSDHYRKMVKEGCWLFGLFTKAIANM
jgi:hypothetical protein